MKIPQTIPQPIQQPKAVPYNPYAGMAEAEVTSKSPYFLPRTVRNGAGETVSTAGSYKVQVLAIKHVQSSTGGVFFVAECKVLASNVEELPEGSTASWRQRMNGTKQGQQQMALSNVLQFVASIFKIRETGKVSGLIEQAWIELGGQPASTPQITQALGSDEQPARSTVLYLTTTNVETKAGTNFTRHDWSPCFEAAPPLSDDEHHANAGD